MGNFFRVAIILKSLPLGGKKVISDHKLNNMFKACIFSTKDSNIERYLPIWHSFVGEPAKFGGKPCGYPFLGHGSEADTAEGFNSHLLMNELISTCPK